MTGHGHAESVHDGFKITVEVSSVNRKQVEASVNLPRELDVLEAQIREIINRRISRGRLTLRLTLHTSGAGRAARLRVNDALARAYARELRRLARELKLQDDLSLADLARAPGVLEADQDSGGAEAFWPGVETALNKALDALIRTREREGAHLARDLSKRVQLLAKTVAAVSRRAPQVQERYRTALLERIRSAGLEGVSADDDRLLKEVVLFADRSDISEELARLESHFKQFQDCVKSAEPVGRTLDFLAQEMNREINTIGSKANDAGISREVVVLKTELEKFREQAQNVE